MNTPDNVGGLPELPTQVADVYFTDDDFDLSFMPGMPCNNGPLYTADQMRAYGELCRAAPAGGDPVCPECKAPGLLFECVACSHSNYSQDSAPAGSEEVSWPGYEAFEQFLAAEIDAAPEPLRRLGEWLCATLDEDHFATANSLVLAATLEHSALLRKLQQGADYVMVPRDSAKMVTHVCSEWIDLFRAAPGIEKYERYSYEPAVEELRDEYAAIAASQDQDGGNGNARD